MSTKAHNSLQVSYMLQYNGVCAVLSLQFLAENTAMHNVASRRVPVNGKQYFTPPLEFLGRNSLFLGRNVPILKQG